MSASYFESHTSGSLDANGVWQGTSSTSTLNFDSSQDLQDLGIDPLWVVAAGAFVEGLLDVVLSVPSMLASFIKHPCDPLTMLQRLGEGAINGAVGLANSLVALVSGRDPESGRELSKREYAELVGSLLGTIVGMIVMEYATRAAGRVIGKVGSYVGKVIKGERCSWKPWRSCFVAGTPMRTPDGSKPIEQVKCYEDHGDACDHLWSRSEFDPDGLVVARRVLRQFVRVAPILNLHVGGQIIGTTAEHPYYAEGKGWTPAAMLGIGERVRLEREGWLRVDGVADSGRVETVYNLEVENDHTYFVGSEEWGFAVWAHNERYGNRAPKGGKPKEPPPGVPAAPIKEPSWSKARSDYWKTRAAKAVEGEFSPQNLERMKQGKPPLHDAIGVAKELHHKVPRREGGSHRPDNLQEVWPWEHARIDPFRHYKGLRPPGA